MEKRRYYGRKIKKTRNLYRRKRGAGHKVMSTVLLVLAASAIAFLGFCIGKPLLDYIGNIGKDDTSVWTPQSSYTELHGEDTTAETPASDPAGLPAEGQIDAAVSTDDSGTVISPGSETAENAETSGTLGTNQPHSTTNGEGRIETSLIIPADDGALVAMEAPASALANRSSLAAVLAKAKAAGCNSVVLQLKDRSGLFRYKSSIDSIADSDVDAGSMTLDDIMSVFRENELTPIAEIAVLSDDKGCEQFPDMSFKCIDAPAISWLDYSLSPPRRWANPESNATREYFAMVTAELTVAGFENILITDVTFPDFQNYDTQFIAGKYFAADRYKLLYNVIKSGNMIEMKASDVIGEKYGRTAECLNDVSQLHDNSVALIISRSDLPTSAGYPADAKTLTETVTALAEKNCKGLKMIPVIDSSGFDDAERSKIVSTLRALGYESYIMR